MNLTQTTTSVHSAVSQQHQRWEAYIRDQYKLSALCLCANLWSGYALYVIDHVSTPGYWAMLLLIFPLMLFYVLSLIIARAAKEGSALTSLLPSCLGRILEIALALSLILDAQLILCSAVSLLGEMLPTLRRWVITPLFVAVCASTLVRNKPFALIRLAGLVFFPLLAVLFTSSAPAVTQGSFNHFFPLFGQGFPSVLKGTLWLCGNAGIVCLPLLMPGEQDALQRMRQKKKLRGPGLMLLGFLFSVLTAALYTYLMPPYALARQASVGSRLLLPVQISSSIPGWTLFVCSQILLMMVAYTGFISRCGTFLWGGCTQEKHCPDWLLLLLFLLTLPIAMLYSHHLQALLIRLAPWRILPYGVAILSGLIGVILQKRKGGASA